MIGTSARPAFLAAMLSAGAASTAVDAQSTIDPTRTAQPDVQAERQAASPAQLRGFNEAIENVFPMTPEMVRGYRRIQDANERAVKESPFPDPLIDAVLVSMEPGEQPAELRVAPGIASAISFFDAAGQPWPIRQYVIGNAEEFSVIQMGERSGSLAISPLARVGWTNLVIALLDEPTPLVLRIAIDRSQAHFRKTVTVLKPGPLSPDSMPAEAAELPRAGDKSMLAALSGIDFPDGAVSIPVSGVDARAWIIDQDLYLRSRHPLLSPAWTASLAGPDGLRAYRLEPMATLLFSVRGQVVRADLELP